MTSSARISPTAHYTGWVWYRNGLSEPALATPSGRLLHGVLAPADALYDRIGPTTGLQTMLLARHRVIDHLLHEAIAAGEVGQVVEVAAGLSPRGLRFANAHPGLRYHEADLPGMVRLKGARLEGLRPPHLELHPVDALADDGPHSLQALAERLDPALGTAVITEGLVPYFDRPAVEGMWRRIAALLGGFPRGLYLSDLYLGADLGSLGAARLFRALLSAFARGQVHYHYDSEQAAVEALRSAGFREATVRLPNRVPGVEVPAPERRHVVRVIRAVA